MQLRTCSPEPKYMNLPRLRFSKQLGQDGAVALAVDEPRPDDRGRQTRAGDGIRGPGPRPRSWTGCRRRENWRRGARSRRCRDGRGLRKRPASSRGRTARAGPERRRRAATRRASTLRRRNSSRVPQSPTLAAQLNTQSAPATPARAPPGLPGRRRSSRRPTGRASACRSWDGRGARTRWPRFSASSVAWLPTRPVAPVMKIVFDVVVFMTLRAVQET